MILRLVSREILSKRWNEKNGSLGVGMILLSVVSFVKYEKVYLVHCYVCMQETASENLCSANNNHVLLDMLHPNIFRPQVSAHGTAEVANILVNVVI
jgi:hypothetical protein